MIAYWVIGIIMVVSTILAMGIDEKKYPLLSGIAGGVSIMSAAIAFILVVL